MNEKFVDMLAVGGKSNSLGRANETVELVLNDKSRLEELYDCVFAEDAWVRMRAIDSIEKICRVRPAWVEPYIDRFQDQLTTSTQPSIQWHLSQMFGEVELSDKQKNFTITWLNELLVSKDIDWIVAANAMKTLFQFTTEGSFPKTEMASLLRIQQKHKSSAVIRRATKLLNELS